MKTAVLFLALSCAVLLTSSTPAATKATAPHKDRAVTTFYEPVNLLGVTLKGQYLFVHDDAAMARGEDCTRVYKGEAEIPDNLVLSFHCIPSPRSKATSFTVRTLTLAPGIVEVTEIQFEGTTETHGVPVRK
jgi:hypothetical protein